MQIMPIRDMRNTQVISELCHKSDEPIFITKNGYGDLVVMSIESYQRKLALADVYQKVFASEEDIREGRVDDGETFMAKLKAKVPVYV